MKTILIVFTLLFLISNAFANEDEDSKILENYAKEDRNKIIELGYNIYSITIFSKASKALEHVNKEGRDKVLVDKTYDRRGDSYNIIVPGHGLLNIDPVSSNPYGTSREYQRSETTKHDYYPRWIHAPFNPTRFPGSWHGRGHRGRR
jgi:hypothetical protein